MTEKTSWWRSWEITIDSNWIIAIGMVLLFAFIAYLLGSSIRNLFFYEVGYRVSQSVRNGWFDKLTPMIGVFYSLMFAYSFPGKHLKVAFLLLGTEYAARLALAYLHVAAGVLHFAAVAGSIARQVAFTIILVAIIQWFRSVARWVSPSNPGVPDS